MTNDHEKPEMDDATLDALLGEARWPEAGAGSTRRLEVYWRRLQKPQANRWWLAAALLLLATGVTIALIAAQERGSATRQISQRDPAPIVPTIEPRNVPPTDAPAVITGRSPTELELTQFEVSERKIAHRPRKAPAPDPIDRVIELMAATHDADAQSAVVSLISQMDPADREAELYRKTRGTNASQRLAAAQLLAATATPSAVPTLLELHRNLATRSAAVEGLARVANPALLANLARASSESAERQTLIAGIIKLGNTQLYLDLVNDPQTSTVALLTLDSMPGISTDAFFAALYDPHVSVRLAAARVLGRIDGPTTTARLVTMTEQNQSRREALIALADSRGPEARRFLAIARASGPLGATVESILAEQSSNNH